jgi:hypothetical protein
MGLPAGIYPNIINVLWETRTNIKELEKLFVYPLLAAGRQIECALRIRVTMEVRSSHHETLLRKKISRNSFY